MSLSRLPGSSITLDLSAHGKVVQHRGINHEVVNSEDGWSVIFRAFKSDNDLVPSSFPVAPSITPSERCKDSKLLRITWSNF